MNRYVIHLKRTIFTKIKLTQSLMKVLHILKEQSKAAKPLMKRTLHQISLLIPSLLL